METERPVALAVAVEVARAAGVVLLEGFGGSASPVLGRRQVAQSKDTSIDLVTEFDRRAEHVIVARLRAAFPSDRVLAEEGGASGASHPSPGAARWLVDPLDGTTNFAHGLPTFCVSIARERAGAVEVGVVFAPALGLLFAAARGGGATLNAVPIRVSDTRTLGQAMLATGFPYDRQTSPDNNFAQFLAFKRRAQAVRRLGSAALDLALVAQGTYDGYWEMKLKPWDLAAGALLVEEAGGRVTGWRGEPFSPDRGAALATNVHLHGEMMVVLDAAGVPGAAI